MIEAAADGIEVIVAGKVRMKNIDLLHDELSARAYHGRKILGDLSCA